MQVRTTEETGIEGERLNFDCIWMLSLKPFEGVELSG